MAQAPSCPYCGASSYRLEDQRWLVCKGCGQEFDIQTDVCRTCGRLNRAEVTVCDYCQARLRRDVVDDIIAERSKTRRKWAEERVTVGVQQKSQEEEASQKRMEEFWAQDHARREAAARAALEQRRRERKVLLVVGIISVLVILALLILALVVAQTGKSGKDISFSGSMPFDRPVRIAHIVRTTSSALTITSRALAGTSYASNWSGVTQAASISSSLIVSVPPT
jgi:hypothetical protein